MDSGRCENGRLVSQGLMKRGWNDGRPASPPPTHDGWMLARGSQQLVRLPDDDKCSHFRVRLKSLSQCGEEESDEMNE